MGDLGIPLKIVGSGMIAVAADYYGFGLTGDKNQAYCMSRHNAQASVDALIAARQLLKGLGYTWDDYLFNCGYSEGGQTSMGVLRLCTEKYPDIRFTHTIAGAGPYDIGETYRQLVKSGETSMPSTVISTLLAYNEYCRLGFGLSELFLEPTLSKIEEYLLSKEYVQQQVEANVATTKVHDWLTEPLFDFESTISRRFMEVFEYDNLSKGWTPHPEINQPFLFLAATAPCLPATFRHKAQKHYPFKCYKHIYGHIHTFLQNKPYISDFVKFNKKRSASATFNIFSKNLQPLILRSGSYPSSPRAEPYPSPPAESGNYISQTSPSRSFTSPGTDQYERNRIGGMCGMRSSGLVIYQLLGITVIRTDEQRALMLQNQIYDLAHTLVDHLDSLDGRLQHARMTYYIGISQIADDHIIYR